MTFLLVIIGLFKPRMTIFFLMLLTDWLHRAYDTSLLPVLGFFFMPYTTLVYAAAMLNNDQRLSGMWLLLWVFAVIVDILLALSASFSHEESVARK